ncbi:MAG: fasciclin domain-containing protein, partial [Deinococcota bacterium]
MKKQTSLITLSLMLATPALAGGAGAPVPPRAAAPANCQSIAQIVMNDPQFSTLLTATQGAGLVDTLKSGQYTVFAPTNAAFAKLPSDQLAAVLNDQDLLRSVLLYHVVPGKVSSKQLAGLKSLKTAQGTNLTVSMMGNMAMVGGAHVTRADIPACNGVIHVIDTVLMPTMAAAAPAPAAAAPAPAAPAPAPAAPT